VASRPGLAWPYWLAHQLDPESEGFVPLGRPPLARNLSYRNWTTVGTLEDGALAIVDPGGMVTSLGSGVSLDWWVRGPAGWQRPAQGTGVRQTLVDESPVIATGVDIAGGGVVTAKVYAIAGVPPAVAVEFHNATEAPVALALVLRPWDPIGLVACHEMSVDEDGVVADGRRVLRLVDKPVGAAVTNLEGESLESLLDAVDVRDTTDEGAARSGADPSGGMTAAALAVLTHGRSMTALLSAAPSPPSTVPDAAKVAAGWGRQTSARPGVGAPIAGLREAFAAQAGHLMLARNPLAAGVEVPRALVALGLHRPVTAALAGGDDDGGTAPARLAGTGTGDVVADADGTAATWLLAAHAAWRYTLDRDALEPLAAETRRRIAAVERAITLVARRGSIDDGAGPRLLVADAAARAAAALGEALGIADVATAAPQIAVSAHEEAEARFAATRSTLAGDPQAALQWLAALECAEVVPGDPKLRTALEVVLARCGALVEESPGAVDLVRTLQVAAACARTRDQRVWDILATIVSAASPTWTWPSTWNRRSRGGAGGSGHDLSVAALFVTVVRSCLVAEAPDGLALLTVPPPPADDTDVEVSGLPTPYGLLDLRARRDGEAVVLAWRGLWGARTPVLTVPAIDPDWRTDEPAGSATLTPRP